MGWLAAGCCAVIAGFILHKFLAQTNAEDGPVLEAKSRHDRLNEALVPAPETTLPALKTTSDAMPGGKPTMTLPPRMEVSNAELEIPVKLAGKHTGNANEMPPPPPPVSKMSRPSSPPRLKPPTSGNTLAPPRPGNGFVRPPPSAAASLRVPVTKALSNASLAPTSSIMPPGKQVSRKVILEPGHSPLDWAALINNPQSRLRGKDAPGENLLRITPSQLKKQNGRKGKDVWTVYQGKVYNISPYVPFHPGGAGEILRGAGKDSLKLFMEVHPWVNWDGMLGECMIGILVGEDEGANGNTRSLDEMD